MKKVFKNNGNVVLNLIITGIPSIHNLGVLDIMDFQYVLNLIITGIPSILFIRTGGHLSNDSFKPYYNWNTFNTRSSSRFR